MFNPFGVTAFDGYITQGAPLDKLGATLGFGVQRLRRYFNRPGHLYEPMHIGTQRSDWAWKSPLPRSG
jgi:hypothetical protein